MEHDSVAAPGGLEVLGFDVRVRNKIIESSLRMGILYVCTYVRNGSYTHLPRCSYSRFSLSLCARTLEYIGS